MATITKFPHGGGWHSKHRMDGQSPTFIILPVTDIARDTKTIQQQKRLEQAPEPYTDPTSIGDILKIALSVDGPDELALVHYANYERYRKGMMGLPVDPSYELGY